jgi:hypothetical protein
MRSVRTAPIHNELVDMAFFKDTSLDELARDGNVAQFVSYAREADGAMRQRFSRVAGHEANHIFSSTLEAVRSLLAAAPEGSVNIRSFAPDDPRSKEFVYGIRDPGQVLRHMDRLADEGLHLIVNETVDVADGGVSGVVQGGLMEFAPDDTPRCVEKPGVASLPFELGMKLLGTVYGFQPLIPHGRGERVEFSIHPKPRGWKSQNTLLWEIERGLPEATGSETRSKWPNRFSRHIGDKAYGLLIADILGIRVPLTLVIPRRVAPFSFGIETGSVESWTRTCPVEPQPGLFTTVKGWIDPFALLSTEDPDGREIASVLSQRAVLATHSGAAIVGANDVLIVEGRAGEGDRLMLGLEQPEPLPSEIVRDVDRTFQMLRARLGAIRFEWVHDGETLWIVQLHSGATETEGDVIVPGEAASWVRIEAATTLDALRIALQGLEPDVGILLGGEIGLTSHIADLVRKAGRPAKLQRN